MSLRTWLIVIFLMVPVPLMAQVDDAIEQWAAEVENDEQVAAYADELIELAERGININDTVALSQLPLLTPFQIKALKNYIMLYGQLLSHKELHMVPGFDSITVSLLETITIVAPYSPVNQWRLADGSHSLITGLGGTVEQAAGYRDGRYEGDAIHAHMVYSYNLYNHINVRFVADKDPTEPWGSGNFYGYHLMLNDIGRLERLIVGRYSLQFGQGLTLWTGLAPFNLLGSSTQRFGKGVRLMATFYEEGYQEGIAATLSLLRSWHATAFASKTHGTRLLGGRMEYREGNLVAGLTMHHTLLDNSISLAERVYNQDYFRGNQLFNAGVDALWQWCRLLLFGEVAIDGSGSIAALAGANLVVDSRNSLGISYRHYDVGYQNLMAQPYSMGDGRNEHGWTFDARTRLSLKIDALLSVDIHTFPSLRYGIYHPSSGSWLRAQLGRSVGGKFYASLRYASRAKERNVPYSDSTVYVDEQTLKRQLQGEVKWESGSWRLITRGAWSIFEWENGEPQRGWLVSQQVRYSAGSLQAALAYILFDVDGYYARIYLNESNIQYNFTMPMYYGQGLRVYAVAKYNISRHLTLAAKYAVIHYFDRDSIGSGAAMTEGSNRQTFYLQLRLKF